MDPFFGAAREILLRREVGQYGVSSGDTPVREASVLVPLLKRDEKLHVLLIQRTDHLPTHPGQIAFPGGGRDPEDADGTATALREAQEEIGLRPEDCELLGPLDRLVTHTHFAISPYVARIPYPYPFVLSRGEVAAILILPLADFLAPGALTFLEVESAGAVRRIPSYEVGGQRVWGITGWILQQMLGLLGSLL